MYTDSANKLEVIEDFVDNQVGDNVIESGANVTYIDVAAPKIVDLIPAGITLPFEWSGQQMQEILNRDYIIKTGMWKSTDTYGSLIYNDYTSLKLMELAPIRHMLWNFNAWRGTMKISVRLNASRFHYGALMLSAAPGMAAEDIQTMSGFDHVILEPTDSSPGELILPWVFRENFAGKYYAAQKTWSSSIRVLAPLRNDKATAEVPYTVSACFTDLAMFRYGENVVLPFEAQGKFSREGESKVQSGLVSGPMEQISRAAGSLRNVPVIGQAAGVVEAISSVIAGGASIFGYCKPLSPAAPMPMYSRPYNMTHSHGLDQSINLSNNQRSELGVHFKESGNEMLLSNIISKPMILDHFDWKFTDKSGEIIKTQVHRQRYDKKTYLGWIQSMFNKVRGSVNFHIDIFSSPLHSGRLALEHWPRSNPPARMTQMSDTVIFDIQDRTRISFNLPAYQDGIWDTGGSSWALRVINPLCHIEEEAPPVHIIVWISGGPDCQFTSVVPRPLKDKPPPPKPIPPDPPKDGNDYVYGFWDPDLNAPSYSDHSKYDIANRDDMPEGNYPRREIFTRKDGKPCEVYSPWVTGIEKIFVNGFPFSILSYPDPHARGPILVKLCDEPTPSDFPREDMPNGSGDVLSEHWRIGMKLTMHNGFAYDQYDLAGISWAASTPYVLCLAEEAKYIPNGNILNVFTVLGREWSWVYSSKPYHLKRAFFRRNLHYFVRNCWYRQLNPDLTIPEAFKLTMGDARSGESVYEAQGLTSADRAKSELIQFAHAGPLVIDDGLCAAETVLSLRELALKPTFAGTATLLRRAPTANRSFRDELTDHYLYTRGSITSKIWIPDIKTTDVVKISEGIKHTDILDFDTPSALFKGSDTIFEVSTLYRNQYPCSFYNDNYNIAVHVHPEREIDKHFYEAYGDDFEVFMLLPPGYNKYKVDRSTTVLETDTSEGCEHL